MKNSVRYKLFIFSFLILGINAVLGYAVYNSDQKLLDSEQWLHHSEQVIIQSANIRSLGREMQITSRDFLITDDSSFLEPLNHTQIAAFAYINVLSQLTRDNTAQQKLTDSLDLYMHKLVSYSSKAIGSRYKQGLAAVIAYTADKERKQYTNRINQITNAIQWQEEILFKQRKQMNARNEIAFRRFSLAIFMAMAGLTILLVIIAGKYLYQAMERRKRAAELDIAGKELLFQNKEKGNRAAELLIANKELMFQNEEKGKRADELAIANKELMFQNTEKEKRAAELVIANKELVFQNEEKRKRVLEKEFDKNNLDALINNADDLMWSVDRKFNLITSNHPFNEFVKAFYSKEIGNGTSVASLPSPLIQLNQYKNFYKRALAGESFTEEVYNTEPVEIWSEISFCPIRTGHEVMGIACHSHDITERKLGEIERLKIVSELTKRNEELEQFAYIISHNLRAPVANIIGASSALNQTGLTTNEKAILSKGINKSVIKIDEVIHDLNNILEIKKNINESKEIVNFSRIVDDVNASISHLVDKNDVEIRYDFSDIDEYLTIKPYLYSIFLNLISNSVKYRQPGNHCIIEIMSHLLKDKLELTFSDNGMGIDLDKKGEQVFGLYKRFHTKIEGKGIGLFMVKTQVEALGGKISIKSREDVGTVFKIEFAI